MSEAQIVVPPTDGGYALTLSGNGATTSTTLTPAAATEWLAAGTLAFGGNAQLSRDELTANVVPPTTQLGSEGALGATEVGVAAPAAAGNSGVAGLGFTRYVQNPKSLASLALFPAVYNYLRSISEFKERQRKLADRSESDYSDYTNSEMSASDFVGAVEDDSSESLRGSRELSGMFRNFSSNEEDSLINSAVTVDKNAERDVEGNELGSFFNVKSSGNAFVYATPTLQLSGVVGGLLAGRGGYSVVNFATLKYDTVNQNALTNAAGGPKTQNLYNQLYNQPFSGYSLGFGFGGGFKTFYQYSGNGFSGKLESFLAQESISLYFLANQVSFSKDGSVQNDISIAGSVLAEQRYSSSDGLPAVLADIGLFAGAAGDAISLFNLTHGGINVARFRDKSADEVATNSSINNNGLGLGGRYERVTQLVGLTSAALAFGATAGVLVPQMPVTGSFSMGLGAQEAFRLKWLSKYGVGLGAYLGAQENFLWTFGDGWVPNLQVLVFGSAGAATVLGGYIPLFNGSYVYNSKPSTDSNTDTSSTSDQPAATEPLPTSDGFTVQAPTGANAPFTYAPAAASDSLLNHTGSPLASLTATPSTLFGFSLQSFDAASLAADVLGWSSLGSGLTDGDYTNVPLVGLSLLDSLPAKASFTVNNGKVEPGSLKVNATDGSGQYLGLPSPSNGIYSLGLDVFAALPGNPAPPQATGISSVLAAMPVISLPAASVHSGSPLQVTNLQRIQQQVPLSQLQQSGVYPLADGSPPAANSNSAYTYSGVPVQLLDGNSNQATVTLLNSNPTATVKLSAGSIIAVTLDQDLYFTENPNNESNTYTLLIDIASNLSGSSITNPTATVSAQNLSLNDFSEQDSFSANSGRQGAGVFLSSGLSDQLGLLPSFGAYPLQNRVSYVDNETIVYLNNTAGPSGQWSAVYRSDDDLKKLYSNPDEYQFTTASSPTAITDSSSKTTYVFWVEAANPVIPLTGSNGEENYQQFLDSYWNHQRINYSYGTLSEADTNIDWQYLYESSLYAPEGSMITDLRSFTVELDGETRSLLVWVEVPLEAIKQALNQPDQLIQSQLAVIKTGLINPDPSATAGGYQWVNLFNDASGNSTIREVPWSAIQDSGLTITDLSAANLTVEINAEAQLTPVLSWSQAVRTPYNEAVLDNKPALFVPFAALETGYNNLNLGTAGDANTQTFASTTGLSTAVQGPLTKSTATAVRNEEGLGVLATGLGSLNNALLEIARNAPQPTAEPVVAVFEGSIDDLTLTVTSLTQGTLKVGDLLVGDGVTANTTIKSVVTEATSTTTGTYELDRISSVATPTTLRTLPSAGNGPLSTFSGSFSGSGGDAGFTTLTLTDLGGPIQIGDRVLGLGIAGGVTVQEVTANDLDSGTATVIVDQGPATSGGNYGLASIAGGSSSPYTIEFWTQLDPDSNPAGAGLVGLGQASSSALPDRPVTLPDGWLLSSSFAVERLTYQDALNQSLVSALPSDQTASDLYGWRWGLVATGTNTTAMGGTGGSNISRNALELANLAVGDTIDGVNTFLANYSLTANELTGIDGTPADQIASTPSTEFNFTTDLVNNTAAQSEVATTSLDAVSVLTDSALMNTGFISAADADAKSNLSTMLETLWTFQQETGEVKVNFDLNPTDQSSSQTPTKPPVTQQENYAGFALEFALLYGPAVSVNGDGQIAYDVGAGVTLQSDTSIDYRDGQWHYVAVSFLPNYNKVVALDTLYEVPSNVGTAYLYIDGELVASQSNVIDPYAPINLDDNAQLLADNAGAIDLLAFYDQALTTLQTPAAAEGWPMPTSTDALELMQEAGFVFAGRTPHPGEQPGAISNHYLAHTVDPNDALEATFTSVLMPDDRGGYSWSEATALSPQVELSPTLTSASNQSPTDALLIPIDAGDWQEAGWFVGTNNTAVAFNPVNRKLESISLVLTPADSSNPELVTRTLTASDVLLGSASAGTLASLQTIQPFSADSTAAGLQYRFLSDQPALNLKIRPLADQSTGEGGTLNPKLVYTAQVTLNFADNTSVSNVSSVGTQGLALGLNTSVGSTMAATVLNGRTALATAQVIEQAPLQLKYIDSGVQFASQFSPANPSPASTFGASQVYGSFADPINSGLSAGWIAIAQPRSNNASSDPAGRVWVQYAGSFAFDSTSNQPQQVSSAIAPTTWLNALSTSTFSPDQPNLPLLDNAFNPSQVGGLLIKADPTDGWGQNLGDTMLVADVNNDGVDDLVLAAPQANGGGAVIIIDGQWIQSSLTQENGKTVLDLSNPDNLGQYVTILTPDVVNPQTDLATVAAFGSALAFVPGNDAGAGELLIGAPNYLRTFDSSDELDSTVPIGALYSYHYDSTNQANWGSGSTNPIKAVAVGAGGTLTITQAGDNNSTTDYWGAQLGTSIAVDVNGRIAVSSPGVMGAAIYSGTEAANEKVNKFKVNAKSSLPEGLLTQVQVGQSAINTTQGLNNPGLQPVTSLQKLSREQNDFLNEFRKLQNAQVANATTLNNQAIQYGAFGAVTLFNSIADLQTSLQIQKDIDKDSDLSLTPAAVASADGKTIYGPNIFNTLGDTGFGTSLTFVDLINSPTGSQLVVGADKASGGGMVYVLDPSQLNTTQSLGDQQYLAIDAATNLISAAAANDYFGSGLINVGDVNQDGYEDLLMQAYNADNSAGNATLLFGSDQLGTTVANRGSASLATSSIGTMSFVDGSSTAIGTLSLLGEASSLAAQGMYGPGDYNADGYPDLPLGSGVAGKTYLAYGHPYLEAITNLQLNKLASNNGFMLDGLATTTQASLRSIGDFNGDGFGDFISINPGPAATSVRIQLGANTQEILAEAPYNDYTFTVSLDTQVVPAGDLNGDGLDDLALFIDNNLTSQAEGNLGAGSTTGILYGRSSEDFPVGSGFGFLSPVSADGQPLAALPSLPVAGGLSDVAPCFIAAGTTIYAAVKGNGASDSSIWFTESKDSGSTWADWVDLSSAVNGLSTATTPSMALFNNTLYLALATPDGQLAVSSWDPASSDPTAWSDPQLVANTSTEQAPQLLDRGDSLGVIWVDASGAVMAASSTAPGDASVAWTSPIQMRSVSASGTSPILSTTAASYTWLGTTPVLAVTNTINDSDAIEVYAGIGASSGLKLISTFHAPAGGPSIASAPVITATNTGLALSFTNSDGSVSLARLNLLNDNGVPLPGVLIDANGALNITSDSLTWSTTTLDSAKAGISTSLATTPLSVNGNLLLANIRTDAQFENQIWIDLIPNLPDAAGLPWINSTIQLTDGNGGWVISQTDASAPSTLTAVGDLDGDGNDDLVITNPGLTVSAVSSPDGWSGVDGGSSPASPALAQLGDTLYMAVQGNGNNLIYWSSSIDGGSSWADWQALPSGMTSTKPPSLAAFDGSLYLSYLGDGNNEINITRLSDAATNTWTSQYQIPWSGGTQSADQASLVSETINGSEQLAVYYTATNGTSDLLRTASSVPASSSSWSDQISVDYNNGAAPQTASGPLAVTSNNGQTVIAYQGGTADSPSNEIYLATSSSPANSSSWSAQAYTDPGQRTGLGLTNVGDDLLLSFSDSGSADALQLQTLSLNDSNWEASKTDTTALISSGSNLVSILQTNSNSGFGLLLAGINSSNGNAVEVQTASTTTSMPGARLISGAASAGEFVALNDATNSVQAVQLAPALTGTTAENTISAALTGSGSLSLSVLSGDDAYSVSGSFTDPDPWLASANAADPIASAQQLFSNAFVEVDGWTSTPAGPLPGDPALNTTTSFGDLNGDGYEDYFDASSSLWIASAPQAPVFSLWSLRAAGDVNGNGVDDILLALTPQGPSYQAQSDGKPAAIYSALIDGALFNVDQTTNTFNLSDLKAALNPYNSIELYDVTTSSYSDEYQSLQNWFSPILKYQAPISIDSVNNLIATSPAPTLDVQSPTYRLGGANSPAPTITRDDQGNLYTITTWVDGYSDSVALSNVMYLGIGQNSLDPNSVTYKPIDLRKISSLTSETFPSHSIAPLTPGAAIHNGKLFVAIPSSNDTSKGYGRATNDIWIAYADLGDPESLYNEKNWTSYLLSSDQNTTSEYTLLTPTLVSEGERLAIYFPAGYAGNNDEQLNIHYLYSNDPTSPEAWGSTLGEDNAYTDISSTISIKTSLSTTPPNEGWASPGGVIVTSPIAATTYQGRTVLAFRGYSDGAGNNVENGGLLLAFAPTAQGARANSTAASADWTLWDTTTTGINTPSITTDQANLYLTYTPWDTNSTNAYFFPVALNIDHLSPDQQVDLSSGSLIAAGTTHTLPITLQQAGDNRVGGFSNDAVNIGMTSSTYAGGYFLNADTLANNIGNAPQSVTPSIDGNTLYVTNQVNGTYSGTMSAAVSIDYTTDSPTFGDNQISKDGYSLAGYSIDGNIDVNGDGFTDILLSDPSDPSLAVDNQYVLFGGDYLDIASQVGTNGDDTLIGTPLADVIYTIAGDDTVISNGGADVIYAGAGADTISITGNSFFRVDAGSGIDTLLLEGDANQSYDFRLDVADPDYFAGTKLRNIELISSIDYGSNTLSLDPKAVSAFNDQRMLFLTPDNTDFINFSSDSAYGFVHNTSYDTNFGGAVWNAYAATPVASTPTLGSPSLVYVLNPEPGDDDWLRDHVITTASAASSSLALLGSPALTSVSMQEESSDQAALSSAESSTPPTTSPISYAVDFGEGLTLTAYKANSTDDVVRFVLTRSNTDRPQVVTYASSSANSTADPGSHYTAVAGLIRLEPGQSSQTITIPLKSSAIQKLRSSQLSLQVEEIPDLNQQPIHLLIDPDDASSDGSKLAPVLSSFQLEPSQTDNSAQLTFRADVNAGTSNLKLSISQRNQADSATPSQTKDLQIADFSPSDQVEPILDPVTGAYRLDTQHSSNGQISTRFQLNFDPTTNQPVLALLGADNPTLSSFALSSDSEFSIAADQPLIAWRSDANPGEIDLALVSATADRIGLLDQAAPSQAGSLNSSNLNDWITTEGKAIGANSSFRSLPVAGHNWTPVASHNGVELSLEHLSIDGSTLTATFAGGIKVHLNTESTPTTPSTQPLEPEIIFHRLGDYQNEIGFYRTDDLTGSIGELTPGDSGYLQAALARSQEEGLYLTNQQLPAYSKTATFSDLSFDQNYNYGVVLAVNGDHSNLFSSYSAANPNGAVQMVHFDSLANPGYTTIGIEDLAYDPNNPTTSDYNDIILQITRNSQIAIF